jgi:hypothetical protein
VVEVLLETGFERFKRQAVSRRDGALREEIAGAVEGPDDVLIGGPELPGNLIPTGRLLRADRRPGAELTRRHGRA